MTTQPAPARRPAPPPPPPGGSRRWTFAERLLGVLSALLTLGTAALGFFTAEVINAKDHAQSSAAAAGSDLSTVQSQFAQLKKQNDDLTAENNQLRSKLSLAPTTNPAPNSPIAPPNTSITEFRIVPDGTGQTGPNSFAAGRDGHFTLNFQFVIRDTSGDIDKCTISTHITNTGNGMVYSPGLAPCPSNSFEAGIVLTKGAYRADADVFVPATGGRATASYEFAITG